MISNNHTNLNLSYHPPNPCLLLLPRSLMLYRPRFPFPSPYPYASIYIQLPHTHRFLQILQEGLCKQEGFQLRFELRQCWYISQNGRQRIPERWCHETERTLSKCFEISLWNFQQLFITLSYIPRVGHAAVLCTNIALFYVPRVGHGIVSVHKHTPVRLPWHDVFWSRLLFCVQYYPCTILSYIPRVGHDVVLCTNIPLSKLPQYGVFWSGLLFCVQSYPCHMIISWCRVLCCFVCALCQCLWRNMFWPRVPVSLT